MRKIYQKYFEIPEEGKGTMGEHVFFARLMVAIACIVLCMSAMGFTAYAFFTASVSSSMNQIQAASFDLEVAQIEPQTETLSASHESEKTYKLQPGDYKFVLERRGDASTGYCQIMIVKDEMTESVYTRQFGESKIDESPVDRRTIQIEVEEETIVKFIPCWGTFNVEEKDRFDEQTQMIVVNKATDTPVVTSKPTATSIPESMSEPSETQRTTSAEPKTTIETVAPTGTTTPASNTTPTETTNTLENIVTPKEEKKDEAASSETEGDTAKSTESTDDVTPSTTSTE